MQLEPARAAIDRTWEDSILPTLCEYIRIPAKSPHFDPAWQQTGALEGAVALAAGWCERQPIEGMTLEVVRLPGRTPLLLLEIPGAAAGRVLLYGHLDKQPEMEGWAPGLGPWEPVLRNGRLYGRGGADDGYAVFASLTALAALRAQGVAHAPCAVLIETCEESGSYDLPFYLEHLAERLGRPDLVVCLDSGCGNYDQLWCTTSLRGIAGGVLRVRVLEEGVHSGDASGVVPSSFRIARSLLGRLEDAETGTIRPAELHTEIPEERRAQAQVAARVLGDSHWQRFPFVTGAGPARGAAPEGDARDGAERVLDRTWRPALEVTGAAGLPTLDAAGNVLRPETALKLSLRLPPTLDAGRASESLRAILESDAPCGTSVRFEADQAAAGWNAPPVAPWLAAALERASQSHFGREVVFMGEGGTIPFMAMLGERFPEAQFVITGVLGPGANAHGPNEFLHLATARRLTGCVAQLLEAHAQRG